MLYVYAADGEKRRNFFLKNQHVQFLLFFHMMKYGLEDGTWPAGTSQYEKRGAAVEVPQWDMTACIQCNQCAYVCPHAAIRPILLDEAEAYDGPSLVICYCPCIEHGMKRGMGLSQEAEKDAVQSGYWQLYRYNPDLAEQGKNPFQLDYSKEPNGEFQTFIKGQNRYASLKLSFPEKADGLYEKAEADAKHRFETYKELADD